MRRRLAVVLGVMLAGLALNAAPAAAEDAPIPRVYPENGFERASTTIPPETIARDTAAADAYEAECNRAAMAGCAALGSAFEAGTGRPQNRPVAELLYREACAGGVGEACFRLGKLLRSADRWGSNGMPGDLTTSAEFYVKSCRMGWAAGCEAEADDVMQGNVWTQDEALAFTILRETCARGSASTCNKLADWLMRDDRPDADKAEGLALLDRQCRAGQPTDCRDAARYWALAEGDNAASTRGYNVLGCEAGNGNACAALGTALLRGEWPGLTNDNPRSLALGYYERACTLDPSHCDNADLIRNETTLVEACAGGERAPCDRLAAAYDAWEGPLTDLPKSAAMLEWLCHRAASAEDVRETCAAASERLLKLARDGGPRPDSARLESHLSRACAAGSDAACGQLADALADGTILPPNLPRALAIHEVRCEAGSATGCGQLRQAIAAQADAPLALAGTGDLPPEYSPEEIAEQKRAYEAVHDNISRSMEEDACTTTTVEFRGQTYTDTICYRVSAIISPFTVKVGSAPWQALIWRPERLGPLTLTGPDRVLCGGTVIRTGWVLTAAHCLIDEDDKRLRRFSVPIERGGHRIRLGVFNPLAPEGHSYRILRVIPHPRFRRGDLVFDIALIQYDPRGEKLGGKVHPVARIRVDPQPMAARTIVARTPAYTFGWGRTAYEGASEKPSELRGARLELRDAENCTRVTGFRDEKRGSVLCASGARGEQACFGDSGGPLVTYGDADKVPTVIGGGSAGIKCGSTAVPSRFTRVAHPLVRDWLNSIVPPATRR